MRTGAVSRYKRTTKPEICHGAEVLLRAAARIMVQELAEGFLKSSGPAKTVTSLFTLLSVL
jgi:hypothetical protein